MVTLVASAIAHAAEADAGDVEAGAAELGVFHGRLLRLTTRRCQGERVRTPGRRGVDRRGLTIPTRSSGSLVGERRRRKAMRPPLAVPHFFHQGGTERAP